VTATRATTLVANLRTAILNGTLQPGEKLVLDQLKSRFQVSLSPLREAISRLLSVGLIEQEDQRGYRVAPVSIDNLREVTLLRRTLETQALEQSIKHADLDWESSVLGALHALGRASTEDDWHAAHRRFHKVLTGGCGLPLLQDLCSTMFDLVQRYHILFPAIDPMSTQGHAAIANAAVARDTETATYLLGAHIAVSSADLSAHMSSTSPSRKMDTHT